MTAALRRRLVLGAVLLTGILLPARGSFSSTYASEIFTPPGFSLRYHPTQA